MATVKEYIDYVIDEINYFDNVRYRKMFGEYMVYVNDKPIILVCDNIVYVKKMEEIKDLMIDADTGVPYNRAKEHYILNLEEREKAEKVLTILEAVTPLSKKKK